MPPRLNKRQLRELEELQALEAVAPDDDEQSDGEEEQEHNLGFAALASAAADEHTASEDEEVVPAAKSKKKKKKKKASGVSTPATPARRAPETPPSELGSSKKEKKTAKKKAKAAAKDDGDDLDKALAALSLKYPQLKRSPESPGGSNASPAFTSLLQVSLSHLDSEAEMRKFFGAKVISASKASSSSSSSAAARRQAAATKSNLTRPQPTWWPASHRQGLSARLLTNEELEERSQRHGWAADAMGEKVWTVEYSRKYRGLTKTFIQMVMSGDPEGLFQLLRSFPYHADTLLQLSEVYFHREEHSTAADFIDRALFTYERAFVGSFNFTSGLNRLDFDRVENRPFFLAVHRQVSDLQRRGCIRTAFEFARLLYSLDPSTDPHGALLHLDYIAIKAGMSDWLLDLWYVQCHLNDTQWAGRMHVKALPGWAYSRALALFVREESKHKDHTESSEALLEAVRAFPSVVPVLADKADVSLSADIRSHPAFRIVTDATGLSTEPEAILHLLSHLYAQRAFSLWKVKSRSNWFASTLNGFAKSLPLAFGQPPSAPTSPSAPLLRFMFSNPALAFSVYRHVIVLEASMRAGRLFGFLPSYVTAGRQLACDPLPPPTRISEYNAEFFQGAEDPMSVRPRGRATQRVLERLIPDPVFRRQLQDFFEAHQGFAQRFPGGFADFAQLAAQLPEDMLEDLMIEVAANGGDRGMPGQMPGEGIFDEDEEERVLPPRAETPEVPPEEPPFNMDDEGSEDDEDEEEVAPLPVRIVRNVLNRFWGGGPNNAEQSSDDEDDQPRDAQGVD